MVLLAVAIALPQLATPAMEDGPCHAVTAFMTVQLGQDVPPVIRVVDVAQEVERFADAAEFAKRQGEPGRAVVGLQHPGQAGGPHRAELERPASRSRSSQCWATSPRSTLLAARASSIP